MLFVNVCVRVFLCCVVVACNVVAIDAVGIVVCFVEVFGNYVVAIGLESTTVSACSMVFVLVVVAVCSSTFAISID